MNAAGARKETTLKTGLTTTARAGWFGSILLLFILFIWANFTMINGAVIASGQAVVRGNPKVVQSLDGGVVIDIRVQDGDVVKAGDLLLSLDPTILQINRDIYRNRLAEIVARQDRLNAEYRNSDRVEPSSQTNLLADMSMEHHYAGQREIFAARRAVQYGKEEQLNERIAQFENQIDGVQGQIASMHSQLEFVRKELKSTTELHKQGLARESAVFDLQKNEAAFLGQLVEHQSELARIRNSIRDTQLEILQSEREFKEKVVTELREVTTAHEELLLEIVTIDKQLERVDILAPADGVVHELQVFTVGGVVAPESTIMQIVPVSEGVEFEVQIDPTAIDQIYIGQKAKVQFPAFDMRTAPILYGELARISPSTSQDDNSGQIFYRATVVLHSEELDSLGPVHLVPGMPVEAFMQTGDRSVLSYLTRPLADQIARAFRES